MKETRLNQLAYVLAIVLLLHSVLRGIRSPNLWSATHFLFNYDFGFAKRGLAGALISLAGIPYLYTYEFFFYFSLTLLLVNTLLLIVLARKGMLAGGATFQWATFVYFSSLGFVFLSHTIGYFDHASLSVVLVALVITRFDLRYAFVIVFLPLSILIHEAGFLIFGPVIGYIFILNACHSPTRARIVSCFLLLTIVVVTLIVVGNANLSPVSVEQMYQGLRGRADYALRRDAFDVLSRDLDANLAMMAAVRHGRIYLAELFASLIVALPATVFLLTLSIRTLMAGKNRRLLISTACVASLSPLLLHAIGWDGVRWNTLTITTSYLVLLATILHGVPHTTEVEWSPRPTKVVAVLIVALGLGSTVALLDGYRVQSFPYPHHVDYLMDVLWGSETFPPKPPER